MSLEVTPPARKRKTKAAATGPRDYRALAEAWEEDALAGRIPIARLAVKAIERQRRELANPPEGFVWDEDEACKACGAAEELAFPKGQKRGERFILEPWEVWLIRVIFGWVDAVSRMPRFHMVDIWLPKGNGKSPLAAAIGLIVLARGARIGAKVYSAAVTEKQAANVFEPAQEMLRLSPRFAEIAQLSVEEHRIRGIGDARTFERVSAEKRSADGTVGDCYIVDEVHQHPTRALYDVLANNASKVEGSRIVIISTAGTDQSPKAIGWLLYCRARAVLGAPVDQVVPPGEEQPKPLENVPGVSHFAIIFEAERDCDPWDEATWRQANPNYGISISARNFRTTAEEARADPTAQPHFFATRLGWWTRGASKWMDMNRWNAAARQLEEKDFAGRSIFLGVDYAPELDLSAIIDVAAEIQEDGKRRYTVRTHGFLPEKSQTLKDVPELAIWAAQGWLTLTPGKVLDAGYLRPLILKKLGTYPGSEVCLDPFGCIELMASLPKEGVEPIKIEQTWKHHSPSMKEVIVALNQDRLVHDGSPVMQMCMANVNALPDRNGNVVPSRDNDGKKIDLAVGLLNAMYRAMLADLSIPDAGVGMRFISLDDEEDSQWAS